MSTIRRALGLAVLAVFLSPAASWAAKIPALDGPYKVGVRVLFAQIDGRNAPFLVWYPAASSGKPCLYSTGISLSATQDALPDRSSAPYPMALFSHGMGGCAAQHVFINENLASHGYVIVAPDYRDAAMCHITGGAEISETRVALSVLLHNFDLSGVVMDLFGGMMKDIGYDFTFRGREARAALDRALEWNQDSTSFLNGMIDPGRIGLSGHSLGGYTTLLVGGMPNYCGTEPPPTAECNFENIGLRNIPNPCCLEAVRRQEPFQNRDERAKAMFVMSPAVMFPDLPRAAAALRIPLMLINGDDEKFEVPLAPLQTIYDHAPAPKYLIVLKDTDHMTAADSTLKVSVAGLLLPGFRSNFDQKAAAYNAYCVAFFNRYLRGAGNSDALSGKVNDFVAWFKSQEK